MNIIDTLIGDLSEKRKYRDNEKRAKALPAEYADAYKKIKHYLWNTSGLMAIDPLVSLVDMLEEAAANDKRVVDITGPDVASFADELVKGESSWKDRERQKLNENFSDSSK